MLVILSLDSLLHCAENIDGVIRFGLFRHSGKLKRVLIDTCNTVKNRQTTHLSVLLLLFSYKNVLS